MNVDTPTTGDYLVEIGNHNGRQYGPAGNMVHVFLGKIGTQQTATITLTADFDATDEKCVLNRAEVTPFEGDTNPDDNWDMDECPEDVTIRVITIAADDTQAEFEGAEFAVYKPGADGNFDPNAAVIPVNLEESSNNTYFFDLETGGVYYLVETKAPVDANGRQYELLAEPVRFEVKIETNAAGEKIVRIETDSNVPSVQAKDSRKIDTTNEIELATIAIADIYNGTLPMAGGHGVGTYALVGMLLFGLAGFAGRRNRVNA